MLQLFGVGDMDENEPRAVTDAFNDPAAAQRNPFVATDAASEGLNLQMTARYLLCILMCRGIRRELSNARPH